VETAYKGNMNYPAASSWVSGVIFFIAPRGGEFTRVRRVQSIRASIAHPFFSSFSCSGVRLGQLSDFDIISLLDAVERCEE